MQGNGSFARTGPFVVLVSRESATRGLFGTDFNNTFPINRDHSEMVKFADDDPICQDVLARLSVICSSNKNSPGRKEVWTQRVAGGTCRPSWDTLNGQSSEDIWLGGKQTLTGVCQL